MAFGNLATKGLHRFLKSESFDQELCVFIHIPKTAGSSLGTELDRLRPPYLNIHRVYDTSGDTVTYSRIEDAIATVIDNGRLATARSCSGHFNYMQAAPIRDARPDARFITFLRDPVQRVISDYRYARTPTHPTYRDFIARFPRIEDYIAAPESQDKMARFMMPKRFQSEIEIDEFVSRKYAFIGLLEMYPMSFNILSRMLGDDATPVEHKRKTEQTADNDVAVGPDLERLIAQHNVRDRRLYDIVRRTLTGVQNEWDHLRGTGSIRPAEQMGR